MKRMKRFLVMIISALLLTGCGEGTESNDMFVCIQSADLNSCYDVVYCRDTRVMYVVSHGSKNNGNFTLLVNADGTPMLYEGESEE